jgi:hypothetical protein
MTGELKDIQEIIAKVIDGTIGTYEFDDGMSIKCSEALRLLVWQVQDLFPSNDPNRFCSEKGIRLLKCLLAELAR